MTKQNKIIWGIIGGALLLTSIFMILIYKKTGFGLSTRLVPKEPKKEVLIEEKDERSILDKASGQEDCTKFSTVDEVFAKAVETGQSAVCWCLKKDEDRKECEGAINETQAFNQAISQFNPALCKKIKNQEQQEACLNIIQSGEEHLQKEDPAYLAVQYARGGDYQKSIDQFEKLDEVKKKEPHNLAMFALALANQSLKEHREKELVPKALSLVEESIQKEPNRAEIYYVKGFIYEVASDFKQAIENYNQAIKLNDTDSRAYLGRGHAKIMLAETEEALKDFEKAKELDKDGRIMEIYAMLCEVYPLLEGKQEKGIENCGRVIASNQSDADSKMVAYQELARLYGDKNDFDKALSQLLLAENIKNNDPGLFVGFARLNLLKKDYARAEKDARKAIELDKKRTEAYAILSQALKYQKKNSEAVKVAQQGLGMIAGDNMLLPPYRKNIKEKLQQLLKNK